MAENLITALCCDPRGYPKADGMPAGQRRPCSTQALGLHPAVLPPPALIHRLGLPDGQRLQHPAGLYTHISRSASGNFSTICFG